MPVLPRSHTLFKGLMALGFALLLGLKAGFVLADPLNIAAGAGYKRPVTELTKAFEQASGLKVETLYGNMGQILTQAAQTDRIAVVFGDQVFLEQATQLSFSQYLPVGQGRLVLAWPTGRHLTDPNELRQEAFARIALPDVQHAVYGKAADEFLTHSGLKTTLTPRLLKVATVPQVAAYLVSGEVDAGFINLTEALGIQDRIGGYLEIDPAQYHTIHIAAGVIKGREQHPGVAELAAFLQTETAQTILRKYGL